MAQNKGYMAKVGLNTSDIDKQIRSLSKELKQIDSALRDNGESAVLNAQRYTVLQRQLEETQKKLRDLESAETRVQDALHSGQIDASEYRNYQRELENTTRRVEQLNEELRQMDENGGVASSAIRQRETQAREEAKLAAEQAQNLSQSLSKVGSAANGAADAIANTMVNALRAAGTQIINITQQATSLYSEYEQLKGGVETLFGEDAMTVIQNADRAFSTAGVSANEYMETATSFAASLVSSLDGNTKRAAESVDTALTDMADNANKMGTSMQAIQYAYQGFAKQNFTMLDNLKLGYGGTKTEMERLLADAEKLSGIHYDISNLDDIINAIHAIQENIGITGTTADEAAHTIAGATASVKAAWQNLLTAMADPEGGHDLEEMVNNFVETAVTSIDNMIPAIEAALDGMGEVVERLAPVISDKLPLLIDEIMPAIVTAVSTLFNIAVSEIGKHSDEIIATVTGMLDELWKNTDGSAKAIMTIITGAWATLKGLGIAANVGSLIASIKGAGGLTAVTGELGTALNTQLIPALGATGTSVLALTGYAAALAAAFVAAKIAASWIDEAGDKLSEESKYWNNFTDVSNDAMARYAQLTNSEADEAAEAAKKWIDTDKKLLEERKACLEELKEAYANAGTRAEQLNLQSEIDAAELEVQALENVVHREEKVIEEQQKAEEEAVAQRSRYADQQEEIARISKANAKKSSADMVKEIEEGRDKELAAEEEKWDAKYKWDKKNQEEYWTERKKYLETHRNNTEAWWTAWREVEKHEQDKLDAEEKERERQRKEREKAEQDAAKAQKEALQKAYSDIAHTAKMNDYDQGWVLERQKAYLDTLDKSSDLYREYIEKWEESNKDWQDKIIERERQANKKLVSTVGKFTDDLIQDFRKRQEASQKEAQTLVKEGKKAAEKLIDEYQSGQQSIMDAANKPQKVTDIQGNDRLIFTDYQKKLTELKRYRQNLDKLSELGLSDEHMKEIFSMDLDTRMLYIKELLKMTDSNRQAYLNEYESYRAAAYDTAKRETDLSGRTDEIMKESIDSALDDISENSYIKGKEAREQWMKGFAEGGGAFGDAAVIADQMAASDGTKAAAASYNGNVTINVAGTQAIKVTLRDILNAMKNSGGVLDV